MESGQQSSQTPLLHEPTRAIVGFSDSFDSAPQFCSTSRNNWSGHCSRSTAACAHRVKSISGGSILLLHQCLDVLSMLVIGFHQSFKLQLAGPAGWEVLLLLCSLLDFAVQCHALVISLLH
jgi:hypothetical protein